MTHGSRHILSASIPTGPQERGPSIDMMERDFGVSREDPARTRILMALAELGMRYGLQVHDHPDLIAKAIEKGRRDHEYEQSLVPFRPADFRSRAGRAADEPRESTVYYLRVGRLVKIGTTVNLTERIRSYPPDATLLATEPGGYEVERGRHRQFAASLEARNEWFAPTADLIEHINALREQPLTAAELAA